MKTMISGNKSFKDSYTARRKANYGWQKIVWLLASLIFVYFGGRYFFDLLRPTAVDISRPVLEVENIVHDTTDTWQGLFKSKVTLEAENDRLKTELRNLQLQSLGYGILIEENNRLREILGRKDELVTPIIASLLATPDDFPYGLILLDAGRNNTTRPVRVGDEVRVGSNVILARVVEVSDTYSKARLLSASGETTPVIIGADNLAAEARGLGGGNFSVFLPRGVNVEPGDQIKLPSTRTELVLGVVAEIKGEPSDPFQEVLFKSPINVNEVRNVEIYVY